MWSRLGQVIILAGIGIAHMPAAASAQSPTPTIAPVCVGDCDGGDTVTIGELLTGVKVVMGNESVDACHAIACDARSFPSVVCILKGVKNALDGCRPRPTPGRVLCGDPIVQRRLNLCQTSRTKEECERTGGVWPQSFGQCVCSTGQDNCPCTSHSDCLAGCFGFLTSNLCNPPTPQPFCRTSLNGASLCGCEFPDGGVRPRPWCD